MPSTVASSQPARFARFEVHFRAGELRKEGRKIRLQQQPFQVLVMLLESPGGVVTREELQRKLWPADTFVDFDHGLNSAVARLREALNDSAEDPKYIETVARRGYRFIGRLEEAVSATNAAQDALPRKTASRLRLHPLAPKWQKWASPLAGFILLVFVSGIYFLRNLARPLDVNKTIDSVAVLPFENAASSPETDFLADGITQSAIDHLSRLGNLKVISMGSISRYRGRQDDPKQIGHDLGVRSVMTGKIVFHADRMVVMAELVDTSDGTHIWGEQYDRKVSDIMSLQEDIASEIATKLESRLSRQQEKLLRKRYTQDFEAYEIYLRGRYYWNRRSQADLQRGIAYFQQAIERDPKNALAYAGLADSYFVRAISGALPTGDAMAKAKAAALKALELDESLPEAHTSLAQISANYEWNWSKAESEYKRAIELNPNYSTGHHYYATFLMGMGRPTEALEEMKRAQELDPLSPIIATFIGKAYYYAGNNEEAIKQYQKALDLDPSFPVARSFLIHSLEQAGRFQEAVAQSKIEAAQSGRSPDQAAACDRAFRVAGASGYWKEVLRQRQGGADPGPGSDLDTAAVYANLGDKEEAFSLLNRAFDQHNMWLMNLKVDPRWDSLRSDARFQSLLVRVGLK
jgi:TolB-like protein/DNA-binding winged helix-turn-helix (wHTH) protein/thioredoxin-like negative regulator of GroEL